MTQSPALVTDLTPDEVYLDVETCFAPNDDGLVTAVCTFRAYDDKIVLVGYAVDESAWADLLETYRSSRSMSWESGSPWSGFGKLVNHQDGYLRVDDRRTGYDWSYRVWLGTERLPGVSLMPRTVYHWFGYKVDTHEFPRLDKFEDVLALSSAPEALHITKVPRTLANRDRDDDELQAQLGNLDDRVVVWDLGSIWRHMAQEQQTNS